MSYREPPIDTVLRHLSRAADVARKRRVRQAVAVAIQVALLAAFGEIDRQRDAGRRK